MIKTAGHVLAFTFAVSLGIPFAGAQRVSESWVRRDRPPRGSALAPVGVVLDKAGNAYIATSFDGRKGRSAYTAKYAAADGAILWRRRYHGPGFGGPVVGIAVDGNSDVFITGQASNLRNSDIFTVKYSGATGRTLWEQRYASPADDYVVAIVVDLKGDVIIAGQDGSSYRPDGDYYTAKYAGGDGALLWERRYDGPIHEFDYVVGAAVDRSGDVIVTGMSDSGRFDIDIHTIKYSGTNGSTLWERRYDRYGGDDRPDQVAVDSLGNVVVLGAESYGSSYFDYLAKYAARDGKTLWEKRRQPASNRNGASTVLTVDEGDHVIFAAKDLVARYSAKGSLLWETLLNESGELTHKASKVGADSEGNVVVAGHSTEFRRQYDSNLADFFTAKYAAADGRLLWRKHYDGPPGGIVSDERVSGLAFGSGSVVVTGSAYAEGVVSSIATVKYQDAPIANTAAAQEINAYGASLRGSVNPSGFETTVSFEYGLDSALLAPFSTGTTGIGNDADPVSVSATVSSLYSNSTYYYRVVASGNGLTTRGHIRSFTTTLPSDLSEPDGR